MKHSGFLSSLLPKTCKQSFSQVLSILCYATAFLVSQTFVFAQQPSATPPPIVILRQGAACRADLNVAWSTVCDKKDEVDYGFELKAPPDGSNRTSTLSVTGAIDNLQAKMQSKINYPSVSGPAFLRSAWASLSVNIYLLDTPENIYSISVTGDSAKDSSLRGPAKGDTAGVYADATTVVPFSKRGAAAEFEGRAVALSKFPGIIYKLVYSKTFSIEVKGWAGHNTIDAGLFADAQLSLNISTSWKCQGFPIEIKFAGFIPGDRIIAPGTCVYKGETVPRQLYDNGNNRSFKYDADGKEDYKIQQIATLDTVEACKFDPTSQNNIGLTKAYASDSLKNDSPNVPRIGPNDEDGIPGDCSLFHMQAIGSNKGMQVEFEKIARNITKVTLRGNAKNPLLILGAGPGISWEIMVTIDATGSIPKYTIEGEHDGFPAYELYLNKQLVYKFWPGDPPYDSIFDPFFGPPSHLWPDLAPGMDVKIIPPKTGIIEPWKN